MIFVMLLIVVSFSTLVDVDLATDYFSVKNSPGALNTTYIITGVQKKYISIEITLSEENPYLLLVSNQTSAVSDLNQEFTQGQTIDLISSYENRLTRYLFIEVLNQKIFVSTIDTTKKTVYDIKITARDSFSCANNCYDRGYCSEFGCECYSYFIGDDCRQIASLIEENEQEIILQQNPQFFYLNLYENSGEDITIEISTDEENDVQVYFLITQALIVPNKYQTFDESMYITFNVNKYDPKFINIQVPDDIYNQEKLVFTVYIPGNSTISNASSLYFSLNNEDTSLQTYILVLIIVIPVIVLIFIFLFAYRFIRRKQLESDQRKLYQVPQIPSININMVNIDSKLVDQNQICVICDKNLVNGEELIEVICKNIFHKDCITKWVKEHFECPICRTNLVGQTITRMI